VPDWNAPRRELDDNWPEGICMSLWTKLVNFVEGVDEDTQLEDLHEEELRIASAALLINAGSIDGNFDSNEKHKVKALLQRRFDLSSDELKRLFHDASAE